MKTDIEGDYKVYIEGAVVTDSSCEIFLDGTLVISDGMVKGSGNWDVSTHNYIGNVHLEKDRDYMLKFAFKTGDFSHKSIVTRGEMAAILSRVMLDVGR